MRLVALDGLRGLAALCILFYHAIGPTYGLDGFRGFALAVDFFFVLSGFVVARAYEHRLSSGLTFAGFTKIRFRRLYPTIAAGILIGGAVALTEFDPLVALALTVAGLLFVPLLDDHGLGIFPANGPQWSLFFEFFANVVHGLLLWRLRVPVLLALWVTSLGLAALGASFHRYTTLGVLGHTFWFGFARVLCGYIFGILLYRFGFKGLKLNIPAARWLGDISYPLYAVHYPVITAVMLLPLVKPVLLFLGLGLPILVASLLAIEPRQARIRASPQTA